MEIRKNTVADIEQLVQIWYESSIKAHDFINHEYWDAQKQDMKEKYLPMSETYVLCVDQEIIGFVSVVGQYLAALFIANDYQGNGYGKELVSFIKQKRKHLQLKVYAKNEQAVQFYLKNHFLKKQELIDEQTGEKEMLMEWKK
ncbi:GNAT family N-acetyltransferase [Priestia megaterium]|nr:GNAT family N-acetyltransferase [Priestia megaterium]